MEQPKLLIAGEWVATEKALPVINPHDESVICDIPIATEPVIDAAIAAAEAGAADMRRLPTHTRSGILTKAATLLEQRADEFTESIIAEAGKPRKYATDGRAGSQEWNPPAPALCSPLRSDLSRFLGCLPSCMSAELA